MANKRFYWLKLKEDFFNQREMKKLRKLPAGEELTIIYLKLLLKGLKTDGVLLYAETENNIFEQLSIELDENQDSIKLLLGFLMANNLMEQNDKQDVKLLEIEELTGSETQVCERVRKHRERKEAKKKALQCNNDVTECNTEKEKEKEIEKEIEKDINPLSSDDDHTHKKQQRIDYQSIVDTFHSICIDLPKIKILNDKRKKAIKVFVNELDKINKNLDEPISINEFFELVQNSYWLTGGNDRGWKANFDWVINKNKVVDIVEGKYPPKQIQQADIIDNRYLTQISEIVDYLNLSINAKYTKSTETSVLIIDKLEKGFAVDDFKTVIDKKVKEWRKTQFQKGLNPKKLFGENFEIYLNQVDAPIMNQENKQLFEIMNKQQEEEQAVVEEPIQIETRQQREQREIEEEVALLMKGIVKYD